MEGFGMAGLFGLILGFMFGVGCAAAVIYTIYMGGYKKGLEDSVRVDKSKRYEENMGKVLKKIGKDSSRSMER